ncbi:MAG: VOC family protein [Opitutaceae bacterium]|nr:VOC family protein [Opitutaceae bacterium]
MAGIRCMAGPFSNRSELQNRLFAELSQMFGVEVPLYAKSLLVNRVCNETLCALLATRFPDFSLTAAQQEQMSGERHGAIRLGRPDEYHWMGRFFAVFGMEPHNYYDMTKLGAKSQPIIATAFRSRRNPEHRIFCSLLMTDYFAPATRARLEAQLATREIFSAEAKALIEQHEQQGGLTADAATQLIQEAVQRIFKWTGRARNYGLYQELCAAGFKIAADIVCFESHHLNHLTPNTLWLDLYTAAMRHCLGELRVADFRARAALVLARVGERADHDYLRLHFKHLPPEEIAGWKPRPVSAAALAALTDKLTERLQAADLTLADWPHAGFKENTEGPAEDTPILLRQDAYRALTEPVLFTEPDGSQVAAVHTARFGEIEQRFYATTPAGRSQYDACLTAADAARSTLPRGSRSDLIAAEKLYAAPFAVFPKTLSALLAQKLVYGYYRVTAAGRRAAQVGAIEVMAWPELIRRGYVVVDGLRYEDFLPVSAAGIFASNLKEGGTPSTAGEPVAYPQSHLEAMLGRKIIDTTLTYAGLEAESQRQVLIELGLWDRLAPAEQAALLATMAPAQDGPAAVV